MTELQGWSRSYLLLPFRGGAALETKRLQGTGWLRLNPIALRIGERGTIYLGRADLQRIIFRPGPRNIHELWGAPPGTGRSRSKAQARQSGQSAFRCAFQFARTACRPPEPRLRAKS